MDRGELHRLLLDSVRVGVAALDPAGLRIVLHNPQLREWFPACAPGLPLGDLIPGLDMNEVASVLGASGQWQKEIETKLGRRKVIFALQISRQGEAADAMLALQCLNISKVKELEFMIESYAKMIERQNRDIKKEQERVERLLLNIMPKQVYEEWKVFGVTSPQRFDEASILMLDFVDSTQMAVSQDPPKLIAELNDIFTSFDRIAEQFGCERLKTQGDAYIAMSGVPDPSPDHARNIANVALRFVRYLRKRNEASEYTWRCRIGIHSGPVIGSIVGVQKYVYDIFGPGMNMAARLEGLSGPMEITLCEDFRLRIANEFRFEDVGEADIRGFGPTRIYRLLGAHDTRAVANDG